MVKIVCRYCNHICDMLCDSQKCKSYFLAAIEQINCVLKRKPNDTDGNSASFTNGLKRTIAEVNRDKNEYEYL